jgi:hypothetical protein
MSPAISASRLAGAIGPEFEEVRPRREPRFAYLLLAQVAVLAILWYCSYFMPKAVGLMAYAGALAGVFYSRHRVFWFSVFFVIIQSPGYFFQKDLPLLSFGPRASFDPRDLFVILFLFRAVTRSRRAPLAFSKPILALLGYVAFSFVISMILYPFSLGMALNFLRPYVYYGIAIAFPLTFWKEEDVDTLVKLLLPWVFFIVAMQLYCFNQGKDLINRFLPETRVVALFVSDRSVRPIPGGHLLLVLAFIVGLALIMGRSRKVPGWILWGAAGASLFGMILAGLRAWSFIFFIILLLSTFGNRRMFQRLMIAAILLPVALWVGQFAAGFSGSRISSSVERVSELEKVFTGEGHKIDTARDRIEHSVRITAAIRENPLIGWGFSTRAIQTYNNDVGFWNTLLLFGIPGFFVIIWLIVSVFGALTRGIARARETGMDHYVSLLSTLRYGWLGLLIGYATLVDIFTWSFAMISFISLYLALCDHYLKRIPMAHHKSINLVNTLAPDIGTAPQG